MARFHRDLLASGARVVGISVDPPERNAAMVEKLSLPFPLLSDPNGEAAIRPYGVWHDGQNVSLPAVVLITPNGEEALRQVGEDVADRIPEEDVVAAVRALRLPSVEQEPPVPGRPVPGERAVALPSLPVYYRGAKYAVMALSHRVPEARDQARVMTSVFDRFVEAVSWLQNQEEERPEGH